VDRKQEIEAEIGELRDRFQSDAITEEELDREIRRLATERAELRDRVDPRQPGTRIGYPPIVGERLVVAVRAFCDAYLTHGR
jgi:hypothetical protein